MIYELSQSFFFEAAHSLKREVSLAGRATAAASRRIHGHTYHAEVGLRGERDPTSGMVVDLADLRREIDTLRAVLDHRLLDDVEGIGPATLENLCAFIWRHLEPAVPTLSMVVVERRASGDRCTLRRD
ncbi:MAG: 6-pyruvoyl tetrahydropterin synthase family protein [Rhizobacter sp.]|nr:6-pyruvoyl tetrahydropterin synthase family protein [Rhizobacter sp.]